MPIRKVLTSDLDDIAHVCSRAFQDDMLLGDMMHPHRAEYTQDFIDYFRRRAQRSVNDKSHVLLVSFQNDSGTEIITGFADWVRQSGHASPEEMLSSTTDQLNVSNRASDPAMVDVFERGAPFTKHYWSGLRSETWYLDLLATDPSHQRKGFGRDLVMWGVQTAKEENICASVVASEKGEGLYTSCGFKPIGWAGEGEGNPLRDLPGGRILFRDASVQTL